MWVRIRYGIQPDPEHRVQGSALSQDQLYHKSQCMQSFPPPPPLFEPNYINKNSYFLMLCCRKLCFVTFLRKLCRVTEKTWQRRVSRTLLWTPLSWPLSSARWKTSESASRFLTILITGSPHHRTCLCLKMAFSTGPLVCVRKLVFWILVSMLVRIKFRIQRFQDQNFKIEKLKKSYFFDQKMHYIYPSAFIKDVHRTLKPSKRTSSISKNKFLNFFSFFVGNFCSPGSGFSRSK